MNVIPALNFCLFFLTLYLLFRKFAENNPGKADGPEVVPIPNLYMEQLDSKSHAYVKRFELLDEVMMDEYGYAVYGSGVKNVPRGMPALSPVCQEARTVGGPHAYIFKEGDKYMIQADEYYHLQLPNDERYYEQLEIQDRMVVFLGMQPIRFVYVERCFKWNDAAGDNINAEPPARKKPVRRHKSGGNN